MLHLSKRRNSEIDNSGIDEISRTANCGSKDNQAEIGEIQVREDGYHTGKDHVLTIAYGAED
jgi:hypothetical protein